MNTTIVRAQDKWNQNHGYVSKSYKLYQSVAESFASACQAEQTTQSSVLTNFMLDYSIKSERKFITMLIRKKYNQNCQYEDFLQTQIDSMINGITENDINTLYSQIKNEIQIIGKGRKYSVALEYNHTFDCPMNFPDFLTSAAFGTVIHYLKYIYLREIVVFHLMCNKQLMPIELRRNTKIELNFKHNHGNFLFDLYVDTLPFEVFLII